MQCYIRNVLYRISLDVARELDCDVRYDPLALHGLLDDLGIEDLTDLETARKQIRAWLTDMHDERISDARPSTPPRTSPGSIRRPLGVEVSVPLR